MKLFTSAIFLFIFLLGCETVVNFDLPEHTPQIALYGNISPDNKVRVFVSSTTGITSSVQPSPLHDAVITLYEDGEKLGQLEEIEVFGLYDQEIHGIYELNYFPKTGKTYRIEIEKEGYGIAHAETLIPIQSPNFKIQLLKPSEHDNDNYLLTVTLHDQTEIDFYDLHLPFSRLRLVSSENDIPITKTQISDVRYECDNEIFNDKNHSVDGEFGEVFNDDLFEDKTYEFQLSFDLALYNILEEKYGIDPEHKLMIELRNTTESYYHYKVTTDLQLYGTGDLLAEPVQVFDNIEGGVGVFSSYVVHKIEIDL